MRYFSKARQTIKIDYTVIPTKESQLDYTVIKIRLHTIAVD